MTVSVAATTTLEIRKKLNDYFDRLAVIASQYTRPGAKPTINGIHTGHPSITSAIQNTGHASY